MKNYLLIGMCILTSHIFAQSDSVLDMQSNGEPIRITAPLPDAYSNSIVYIADETVLGELFTAIEVDLKNSAPIRTESAWPNLPENTEGFGENLLFINGPLTNDGNLSIMESSLGMNTYGKNANLSEGYRVADDFSILLKSDISSIDVYTYQTGTNPPSITKAYIQIWDGDPSQSGSVIWGDTQTNRLNSVEDTGAFRVIDTDTGNTERKIQKVTVNTDGLTLDPGTYWLDYSFEGSGSSGPWVAPLVVMGETHVGNAINYIGGAWQPSVDSGTNDPMGFPFEIYGTIANDCAEINPPYDWYYEIGYTISNDYSVANDLTVDPGDKFTLKTITVYLGSEWPITEVDVQYFSNDNGLPGNEIGSENNVTIENLQAVGSIHNTIYNVYRLDLKVNPFEFEGQENSPTTYWVSVNNAKSSQNTPVYWNAISTQSNGNPLAQRSTGSWSYPDSDHDGIYIFSGDCEDLLGTDKNEFTQFTAYPNPTSDVLNLQARDKIDSVVMYNLLGQKVMETKIGNTAGELDIRSLQKGMYILKASMEGKQQTVKILKD